MTRAILLAVTVAAAVGAAPGQAWGQETLDSVEARLAALWEDVDAFTADLVMTSDVSKGLIKMTMRGTGKVECLKEDGRLLYRMSIHNAMKLSFKKMEQEMLMVFDGTDLYSDVQAMGRRMVTKRKPDRKAPLIPDSGASALERLHENFTVALLPDGMVDGQATYVLGLTAKPGQATKGKGKGNGGQGRIHFAKNTGLQVRMEMSDAANTPVMTIDYRNFKLSPPLTPDRFQYTPPPGVTVKEVTAP